MNTVVNTLWFLLLFLSQCGMVYAGSITRVDSSPKQMSMAGAGSAQVNDATAMAINPAGMAIYDISETGTVDFILTYGELPVYEEKPGYEDADLLGLYWAKRFNRLTIGVGMYDTASFNLDYLELVETDLVQKSTHLAAYDIAMYLAFSVSEKLKLGSTLKITSLSTDYEDRSGNNLDDEVWSYRLGAKYTVFDSPIDFATSSMQLAWQLAAAYEPESQLKPFTEVKQHPLRNRDITGAPELFLVGSTLRFGWIFERFSFLVNLNADVSQETYSNMSDLLIPSEELIGSERDVVLTKTMLGSEWLFKCTDEGAITYALRMGLSDQRSNYEGVFEEQKAAVGFALIGHGLSMELAVQRFLESDEPSEQESANMKNDDLAWSLGFGFSF